MVDFGESSGLVETGNYGGPQTKMASQPTLQQRLDLAVAQAEERLKAVTRAREIFKAHPELEELLNLMQRNHF